MRITRTHLMKNAENAVAEQLYKDRDIICALLTGSLLTDDFLLGGTADIDLVFIHENEPKDSRCVQRLSDNIHLDIAHISQKEFLQPRQLRTNSWLGCMICFDPLVLHDRNHWFDYVQAGVCAHFMQPDNILQRAQPALDEGRRIWMALNDGNLAFTPQVARSFFRALEKTANAIALLSGAPLTERRFFLEFPYKAEAIERSDLIPSLKDLICEQIPDAALWQTWLDDWRSVYLCAEQAKDCPAKILAPRRLYYELAADAMFSTHPVAAIWLLANNWAQALEFCPFERDSEPINQWQKAMDFLGFSSPNFSRRLYELDQFLDNVEEAIEKWAQSYGIFW